jgi:branched-chain amino acid transport system ATP-binding protein
MSHMHHETTTPAAGDSARSAILDVQHLDAGYHGHPIVEDLSLHVAPGEVVGLLGPNGAGKTTTLLTLAGELKPLGGTILFDGRRTSLPLHRLARVGVSFVTEERSIFKSLSTSDNLRVGRADVTRALSLFPELEPLMNRQGGVLSGGEQQILTLARALSRSPRLLLLDELSLGLAPLIVTRLLEVVREVATRDGVAVLLVEQHARQALRIVDRVYVLNHGKIVIEGTADEVRSDLESAYLGHLDNRDASS